MIKIIIDFLPHLLELIISAPHLQTLELSTFFYDPSEFPLLGELQRLDDCIKSHPSLQQIIFPYFKLLDFMTGRKFAGLVKNQMPYCVKNNMIEFKGLDLGEQ